MIGAWRWPRFLAPLRRRRKPIVRLWDAELNYISTIADGGRETWRGYFRRLGRALLRPAEQRRHVVDLPGGSTLTLDM